MEKIFFISDIHIGGGTNSENISRTKKFLSFLEHINLPGNKLFIVGDLFDFWFEYKHVIPKKYFDIFISFLELTKNNMEIHFLPGNHDYWIRDFFQNQLGFIVHPEEFNVNLQSKQCFFFHGDGISTKDKGYQLLKKIFRNPINIFLYRWLHPDWGIPLAQLSSNTSRNHNADRIIHDEQDYFNFAINKFDDGVDIVIVGHSHTPMIKQFENKYFINLGDWISNFSYGVLSNSQLSLKYWK